MGLEYRGSRVSHEQDIVRLLDAKAKAEQVTDPGDIDGIISSRVSGLANRSYVDSAFSNYATQADVDAAYTGKAPHSALGQSIFTLDGDGKIPVSSLPNLTSRGARWVPGGAVTTRMDIGAGGIFATTSQMASVSVNGSSLMGGRPYYMFGYAQIEVKGNFAESRPIIYITSSNGFSTNEISIGYGIPGWLDYYHLTVMPNSGSSQLHTGNKTMYLTCRSLGASSDFTNYFPSWGLLLVPALD